MNNSGYSVGINEIDNQHKKLIELINRLYSLYLDKNDQEIKNIISEIKDYTEMSDFVVCFFKTAQT